MADCSVMSMYEIREYNKALQLMYGNNIYDKKIIDFITQKENIKILVENNILPRMLEIHDISDFYYEILKLHELKAKVEYKLILNRLAAFDEYRVMKFVLENIDEYKTECINDAEHIYFLNQPKNLLAYIRSDNITISVPFRNKEVTRCQIIKSDNVQGLLGCYIDRLIISNNNASVFLPHLHINLHNSQILSLNKGAYKVYSGYGIIAFERCD